ncbi:MAG: hypothetical protein KF799_09960 [Bdellovibrionales bacterium]|nr:hypothetical protein [Bdellovibrionales bacterium]
MNRMLMILVGLLLAGALAFAFFKRSLPNLPALQPRPAAKSAEPAAATAPQHAQTAHAPSVAPASKKTGPEQGPEFRMDFVDLMRTDILPGKMGTAWGRFFHQGRKFFFGTDENLILFAGGLELRPDFDAFTYDDRFVYLRYTVSRLERVISRFEAQGAPPPKDKLPPGELLIGAKGLGRIFAPRFITASGQNKTYWVPYSSDTFRMDQMQAKPAPEISAQYKLGLFWYEFVAGDYYDERTGIKFPFLVRLNIMDSPCLIKQIDFAYKLGIRDIRYLQNLSSTYCTIRLKETRKTDKAGRPYFVMAWGEKIYSENISGAKPGELPFRVKDEHGRAMNIEVFENRWIPQPDHRWLVSFSGRPPPANAPYPSYHEPSLEVAEVVADVRQLRYTNTRLSDAHRNELGRRLAECLGDSDLTRALGLVDREFLKEAKPMRDLCPYWKSKARARRADSKSGSPKAEMKAEGGSESKVKGRGLGRERDRDKEKVRRRAEPH